MNKIVNCKIVKYTIVTIILTGHLHVVMAQIVNTTLGTVHGVSLTSRNNRTFGAFLGIPYARPPIGELRFQDPQPHEKWTGIRDASSYGDVCPQFTVSATNFTGNEDCLTINVFTPSNLNQNFTKKETLQLPVLVYIHGGYFMVLSGSNYGPRYFMDHDIILVTFNYRLGAFGFLSTQDSNAPGNAGMKDQVMALKWVQDNIEHFGGDPTKVTIYGESAGAAAVHYHLLSPMSHGLFSAAISGSGTSFKILSLQLSPLEVVEKLATEVGCRSFIGNNSEVIACLRSLDVSTIASTGYEFSEILKDPSRMFCPCIEVNSSKPSAFLTRHPFQLMQEGHQQVVPWMVGVNSGEGLLVTLGIFTSDEWSQEINLNWNNLASDFLIYDKDYVHLTSLANEFYLNVTPTDNIDFRRDMQGFTNMFSDRLYIDASLEAVYIQSTKTDVFMYYNDYATQTNSMGFGTIHGEELTLLFSPANFSYPMMEEGHPDYGQSQIMVDLWVKFVQNPYNVIYKDTLWLPVDSEETHPICFIFENFGGSGQGIGNLPGDIVNRVKFWRINDLPPYEETK